MKRNKQRPAPAPTIRCVGELASEAALALDLLWNKQHHIRLLPKLKDKMRTLTTYIHELAQGLRDEKFSFMAFIVFAYAVKNTYPAYKDLDKLKLLVPILEEIAAKFDRVLGGDEDRQLLTELQEFSLKLSKSASDHAKNYHEWNFLAA